MKRWPIIRHIRCVYLHWRVQRWTRTWGDCGIGLGHPNPSDIEHLQRIWDGKE